MKWLQENIKTALGIATLIGFLIGMYTMQMKIGNDIEFIKDEIQSIRDNDLWNIRNWINKAR